MADEISRTPHYEEYGRVRFWIDSSHCTAVTGSMLSLCGQDGQLIPVENVSFNEDRGHNLVADLWAYAAHRPVDRPLLIRMNISLNAFAVLILVAMFALVGMPWTAVFAWIFGTTYAIPGPLPGPDVQSAFLGIYLLGLVPIVWFAGSRFGAGPWVRRLCGDVWACALLALTFLFRNPMGLAACALCVLMLLRIIFADPRNRAIASLGLILCVLATSQTTFAILTLRNHLWHMQPSNGIGIHALSHNLYIGLGTEPNPWDIHYVNDVYGLRAAQKVDPLVSFCSPRYFEILWHEYWRLLRQHPRIIAMIYRHKLLKILDFPIRFLHINWLVYLAGTLLGWSAWWPRASPRQKNFLVVIAALWGALMTLVLQGDLAKPDFLFLYPLKLGFVLIIFGFSDVLMAHVYPTLNVLGLGGRSINMAEYGLK